MTEEMMYEYEEANPRIGELVKDREFEVFQNEEIKKVKISDYLGKWLVLFFYPADFTFICPTELESMADHYEEVKNLNTEVISVSTDKVFSHKAWHDTSPAIKKINFPMAADPTLEISRQFGTLVEKEGLSLRATFIIDPEGILKTYEIHDNSIGRNVDEIIRKVKAAQFVREHNGEVCPVNWQPGSATLKPGLDLVGKI